MINDSQERFIKQYVNTAYFDVNKLISYLKLHDVVGSEIFELVYINENQKYKLRLVTQGYGYEPVCTDVFVKRVPFYFYVADYDKDQHGGLDDLIYGLDSDDMIRNFDWEKLYIILERMFYHHRISVPDLMGYIIMQTGVINRTDLFLEWSEYLDLCENLHINDKFPQSFIYNYNVVLEKSGLTPKIYKPGLVGFNENFLRNNSEIIIGGEFPCDENNQPAMQWIGIWVENPKYIIAQDTYSISNTKTIDKELHIGLLPTTKIYMPNIYNDSNDKEDIWYPIYFGPAIMEFDSHALKFYRKNGNYKQHEVADAIDVQLRTYQKWESGETIPDGYNLIRIMNLLNIDSVQTFVKNEPIIDNGFEKFKNLHIKKKM